MGSVFYPLSEQIADTARVHGLEWTRAHYAAKGVSDFAWFILSQKAHKEAQA